MLTMCKDNFTYLTSFKPWNIPNAGVLYTRKLSTKFGLYIQCINAEFQKGAAKATT